MILFTDLDGTLLNDEKKLSAKNTEAIRQALKRGHQIVICTGRPLGQRQNPGTGAWSGHPGLLLHRFQRRGDLRHVPRGKHL